jgi:hypothetical protein
MKVAFESQQRERKTMKLKIFLCVLLAGLSAPAQTNTPASDQTNSVAAVKTNHLSAYSVHVVTVDEVNAGLMVISNRSAILRGQISDLRKQDSIYEQEMALRWKAGQINGGDSIAAQEKHMSETNKKIGYSGNFVATKAEAFS